MRKTNIKRTLAFALALVMALSLSAIGFAAETKEDEIFVREGTVLVGLTDYGKTLTEIVVPEGITELGENSLKGLTAESVSITLPSTLKVIGEGAMGGTQGLTEIVIPDSVTTIGMHAFHACWNLTSVKLPASLTEMGEAAFARTGITSVSIPAGVTKLAKFNFGACSNLEKVTLPEGLVAIGEAAFTSCNLKEVTLPKSVTTVERNAFSCMDGLKITVPVGSKLQSFGDNWDKNEVITAENMIITVSAPASLKSAFTDGDFSNTTFEWVDDSKSDDTFLIAADGDNVTLIGLTDYGKTLSEVVIPEGITQIGDNAFHGNKTLTSVKLPAGLTKIGQAAFARSGLTSVSIPASVTEIGLFAFGSCTNLTKVTLAEGLTTLGPAMFIDCGLKEVTLPKSVTTVPHDAFAKMDGLKVTVPVGSKLQSFGDNTDKNEAITVTNMIITVSAPASLKSAFTDGNFSNTTFEWVDDSKSNDTFLIVTDEDDVTLIGLTDYGKTLNEIVIPEGITKIGDNAFHANKTLTSVKLPASLKKIGTAAFARTGLTSVSIPASVTEIGLFAFGSCTNLTEVTLAEGLVALGDAMFIDCGLKEVTLPKSVTTVPHDAFAKMKGLKITIPVGSRLQSFGDNDDENETITSANMTITITAPASLKSAFVGDFSNTTFKWIEAAPVKFTDVKQTAWYYDSVQWASAMGITEGTTASTFSPDTTCTKAMTLTMLWRAAGEPKAAVTFPGNVETSYKAAVDWAYDQHIIGMDFNPDAPCTRADAVTYIWLANGMKAATKNSSFTDVSKNASYAKAVNWAVEKGITIGTTKSTFSPDKPCTRAQIVTFLYRANEA